ncbi:hypothetical protein F7725_022691, partial [Dissostichus mawsoni]
MSPTKQGGYQAAALCVAICFGVGGGILVDYLSGEILQMTAVLMMTLLGVRDFYLPQDEESTQPVLQYNNHMRNKT